MTHIVPRKDNVCHLGAAQHHGDAMRYLSVGLDVSTQPDRTVIAVLDRNTGRKADAMRKAMNKIAAESADLNIQLAVSELLFRCNNRILARTFDIAAVHVDAIAKGV